MTLRDLKEQLDKLPSDVLDNQELIVNAGRGRFLNMFTGFVDKDHATELAGEAFSLPGQLILE